MHANFSCLEIYNSMPAIEFQFEEYKLRMTPNVYLVELEPGTCTFLITGYPTNLTFESPDNLEKIMLG
jgi:hypothetical protein